jgi:hypothetical protein
MSQISIGIGTALSFLGIGAFFGAGSGHIGSLIPAFLGIPLSVLGIAGSREDLAEKTTYGAAGLSLLGLLISVQGLFFPQLFPATADSRGEYPMRSAVQAITAVLCGAHIWAVVRSFVQQAQAREG